MLPPNAKVMLPSSATECCHLRRSPKSVQNFIHAGGVRYRGCGWVRTTSGSSSGSKVRFADQPSRTRQFLCLGELIRLDAGLSQPASSLIRSGSPTDVYCRLSLTLTELCAPVITSVAVTATV